MVQSLKKKDRGHERTKDKSTSKKKKEKRKQKQKQKLQDNLTNIHHHSNITTKIFYNTNYDNIKSFLL